MAGHANAGASAGAEPKANMKAHASTYDSVISMLKWGAVGCAIVAALVIWLIA